MENYIYAAIDIGSNAARLLIKEIDSSLQGTKFEKLLFLRYPLRLGDDVFTIGKISSEKQEKMCRMIKSFKHLMKLYNVEEFRACATSAMREASNGKSVIKAIEKETGVEIEIIKGQEEANILYSSHIEKISEQSGTYAFVDVGGGSTEITLMQNAQLISSTSYNIGTIRMLHNCVAPGTIELMQNELQQLTTTYQDIKIIGSGGNINKLYKLSNPRKSNNGTMSINTLESIYNKLQPLNLEERMEQFSLKRDRADVIVPAAQIYLNIAKSINAQSIYVPTLGLADGIIDRMFAKHKQP